MIKLLALLFSLTFLADVVADVRTDIHDKINQSYKETTNLCWYTAHQKKHEFNKLGYECTVLIIRKRWIRGNNTTHAVVSCPDNGLVYDDHQKVLP